MPGMDGLETLREIKKTWPLIEVILLTGHACVESARQGMDEGAFDYLMKPVEINELVYKLEDAYDKTQFLTKKTD
jgi:DNA-binding NtrC family response regulator